MNTPSGRIASLDAFRGFAIASMVLVNNPGSWSHMYAPLAHAKWHGWTFTDMVFPFFLFAAGLSMAVSLDRRLRAGEDRQKLLGSIWKRGLVIFLAGLALNLFPSFDFSAVRIPGVLQRIALCILVAAPLAIWVRTPAVLAWIVALCAIYAVPMLTTGALEPGQDFGARIDRAVIGTSHLWSQSRTWDPEGLWSTLPAVASLLLGVVAGRWLLGAPATLGTSGRLLAAGVAALIVGFALHYALMPINKNLWTPSYAVFMTGWSLVAYAAFHAVMDARTFGRRALLPLTIYGMNALFIFAFSGFVARLLVMGDTKRVIYEPIKSLPVSAEMASLLFAIMFNVVMFRVAWFMWKRQWFVRA